MTVSKQLQKSLPAITNLIILSGLVFMLSACDTLRQSLLEDLNTSPVSSIVQDIRVSTENMVVALSWTNPSPNFSEVIILRTEFSESETITEVYRGNGDFFVDQNIIPGVHYAYEITAILDAQVLSGSVNVVITQSPDFAAPSEITHFNVAQDPVTPSQTVLTWQNPTENDFEYVVVVRKEEGIPASPTDGVTVTTNQTSVRQELKELTAYFFRVYSVDRAGNHSNGIFNAERFILPNLTAPDSPTDLKVEKLGDHDIKASWINPTVADFAYVHLYRSIASENMSSAQPIYTGTGQEFVDVFQPEEFREVPIYYSLIAADTSGNVSVEVTQGPYFLESSETINPVVDSLIPTQNETEPTPNPEPVAEAEVSSNIEQTEQVDVIETIEIVPTEDVVELIATEDVVEFIPTEDIVETVPTEDIVETVPTEDIVEVEPTPSIVEIPEVDITAPRAVLNPVFEILDNKEIQITWTYPADDDLDQVKIVKTRGTASSLLSEAGELSWVFTRGDVPKLLDTDLELDVTYFYTLYSIDAAGNSSSVSSHPLKIVDITPPQAVQNLDVELTGTDNVRLGWQMPTDDDLDYVRVIRTRDTQASLPSDSGEQSWDYAPGADPVLEDFNLADKTDYIYTFFSVDQSGNFSSTASTSPVRFADVTPPVISNILAQALQGENKFSWVIESDDIQSIELGRRDIVWQSVATFNVTGETEYTDYGFQFTLPLFYQLVATDHSGNQSLSGEMFIIPVPISSSITSVTSNVDIALSWTPVLEDSLSHYSLIRKTNPIQVFDPQLVIYSGQLTQYTDDISQLPNGQYYYQLWADDTYGRQNHLATVVHMVGDTTPPAKVTNLGATQGSYIELAWDMPQDADLDYVSIVKSPFSFGTNYDSIDGVNYVEVARVSAGNSGFYLETETTQATYYYHLFSVDQSGNASSGVYISATLSGMPQPTILSGPTGPGNMIQIQWFDSAGLDPYFDHYIVVQKAGSEPQHGQDGFVTTVSGTGFVTFSGPDTTTLPPGDNYFKIFMMDTKGVAHAGPKVVFTQGGGQGGTDLLSTKVTALDFRVGQELVWIEYDDQDNPIRRIKRTALTPAFPFNTADMSYTRETTNGLGGWNSPDTPTVMAAINEAAQLAELRFSPVFGFFQALPYPIDKFVSSFSSVIIDDHFQLGLGVSQVFDWDNVEEITVESGTYNTVKLVSNESGFPVTWFISNDAEAIKIIVDEPGNYREIRLQSITP